MFAHLERIPSNADHFHITPEPPYDEYKIGYVRIDSRDNRRYVDFYDTATNKFGTTYARYLFQINHWRSCGELISSDLEVDHINEDRLDDRLGNYQLLTRVENKRKADSLQATKRAVGVCPVCKTYFSRLVSSTQLNDIYDRRVSCCSKSCSNLFRLYKLPEDILLWLSHHQFIYTIDAYDSAECPYWEMTASHPKDILSFDISRYESRTSIRVKFIREHLEKGYSYEKIAELLSLKSIDYLVYTYLPEYKQATKITQNADRIQTYLEKNVPIKDIASIMNMTESGISRYIHEYYPVYSRKARTEATLERIKEYLPYGFPQSEIAKKVGISTAMVQYLIARHLKEYVVA